jgi:phospholipase C
MQNRREFLGFAARLAGAAGAMGGLQTACLESLGRAAGIEPTEGSSYLDAEHIVVLMQENRSFDHAFGTLRGVRGFNDPRAITLPDGNPVWVQTDANGHRYAPFRLDLKSTKATWMGSLPHSWADQTDARNHGLYDKWLLAKRSGHRDYQDMPLTLGYYTRADIPFYYALADAFTICDQYFCSSLTGTTPNRCYLWTGTVRDQQTAKSPANVRNEDLEANRTGTWTTFPERLEDHGISWKVYQNEIDVASGLTEAEDVWLSNFGDNPLEYFRQYQVQLSPRHRAFVERRLKELPAEIDALTKRLASGKADGAARLRKQHAELTRELKRLLAEHAEFSHKRLDTLTPRERALHERAFCTNAGDSSYRQLAELAYHDGSVERRMRVPKGDVLHQFRADVENGRLPTVSWIVAPQEFSDHPSSAWYGAWYIAEALDILTRNPAVWKKTIFLLTYDENDGYFDHVPPFVAPRPGHPETGRVTRGIDTSVEYVELDQDRKRTRPGSARGGSIGLGYRVPMVIASPWSRGGCVCSQVFDHTSVLQFLEHFLSHKFHRAVAEPNISQWRRVVCGDLTSAFQAAARTSDATVPFPPRDAFLESIHEAQFKDVPSNFHALQPNEIETIRHSPSHSPWLPRQEAGTRTSCPLPYELAVNGALNGPRTEFTIRFAAGKDQFGTRAAGAPFTVYALGSTASLTVRNYAVEAGEQLEDPWVLTDFANGRYHLRVYGPNGFFREFVGGADDPHVDFHFDGARGQSENGDVVIIATNRDPARRWTIEISDLAYGNPPKSHLLKAGQTERLTIATHKSAGWYDLNCRVAGSSGLFVKRYAGRIETGKWSTSDPAMSRSTREATASGKMEPHPPILLRS